MELTKPRLVLKTADAANLMAISQGHLKRQMDTKGGPLIGGEDYFLAWSNQLHGPGSGIRDFVHVVYKRDDGTNGTAPFIFTNMTSAAEFYNRLQLLMRL